MATESEVVVYVRLGESVGTRKLSFARPKEIAAKVLLDHGFAIDGNQCTTETSIETLVKAECGIIDFLEQHGHTVEFQ